MSIINQNEELRATLAGLCGHHADTFARSLLIHPKRLLLLTKIYRMLAAEVPVTIELEKYVQGNSIFRNLNLRTLGIRTILHQAVLLLEIPSERGAYKLGSDRQTIRRMVRKATALKLQCHSVSSHEERRNLLKLAVAHEQSHPNEKYRKKHPVVPDPNRDDLWLAAYTEDLRPIAVSITPTAGNVATLRLFRSLETSQEATLARYLLTDHLVNELSEQSIKYLIDTVHPIYIPSGLHHFASMLGFRIKRAQFKFS